MCCWILDAYCCGLAPNYAILCRCRRGLRGLQKPHNLPASKPGEWGIGSTLPLYVCAQVRGTKNWRKVTGGKIKVVNVTGKASLTLGPPPNASMFSDAQAHCRALKTGLVRFEVTFEGVKGSGHLEIVADD